MTVVIALVMIEDPMMIECPLEEEDIMKGVEGHKIEGMVMTEIFLEEEETPDDGRPPDGNGGPPEDGGPPGNGR